MGLTIGKVEMSEDGNTPILSATIGDDYLGRIDNPSLLLEPGDFVIPARGNSIGHVTLVAEQCTCSQTTIWSRGIKRRRLSTRYAYYFMKGHRKELFPFARTAIPQLTVADVNRNHFLLPPLPEQHAIVTFLDRETAKIDRLKDVRQSQIEVLREQRAAVIHHAVTQGLDPDAPKKDSGILWLGEVPEHWDIKPLWVVARVRFSNVDKKSVEGEQPVLLCNYVDVYKNEFITNNLEFMAATAPEAQVRTFQLRVGDVLLTKDSEDWRDIAVPALVMEAQERLLCGYHLAMLRPRPELAPGYLFRYFLTKFVRHYFAVRAAGVTRFGLSTDDIKRCPCPLPPRQEQEAIVAHIDRETAKIDALISKYERELELLDEYRASLISHVVTGKVDVRGLV